MLLLRHCRRPCYIRRDDVTSLFWASQGDVTKMENATFCSSQNKLLCFTDCLLQGVQCSIQKQVYSLQSQVGDHHYISFVQAAHLSTVCEVWGPHSTRGGRSGSDPGLSSCCPELLDRFRRPWNHLQSVWLAEKHHRKWEHYPRRRVSMSDHIFQSIVWSEASNPRLISLFPLCQ